LFHLLRTEWVSKFFRKSIFYSETNYSSCVS
jgi:hypothetical protein